ncbi:MAG: TonB-dependent receptor [Bacteroidota bacterium]|nr:TonB-dependent receptor [Bacteroidota bacterium]
MRKLSLLLGTVLLCIQLLAQTRNVTGRVTDEKGNPISNASVLAKGTKAGTSTKADGSFSIQVPANAKSLVISAVDMASQELTINGQTLTVVLKSADRTMQEVVVVAYGTQKKADLTGSVATVKAADIENKPFTSVDKALQGGVAGLQSAASSGAPGANQDIRIRGISSINASNAPLWVVDGAIINSGDASRLQTTANLLSTLNPNDIESISVLKDAASTAVYGSRGANGVILVTTKKGKMGKTKFRLDAEMGYNNTAYTSERNRPLNAKEYLDLTREGLVNSGATQAQIDATLTSLGQGNGTDFNWLKAVTRQGSQRQYNLSASGGQDKTTFYVSGGYFKQEGNTVTSDLTRYNGAFRITNQATNRLTLNVNVDAGVVKQNTPQNGGAFGNPILSAYFILPTSSAYKADGSLNYLTAQFPTSGIYNTLATTSLDHRRLNQVSMRGTLSADYKILDNLVFRTSYGADYNTLEEEQYNNPFYGDGVATLPGSPTFGTGILYNPSTTGRVFNFYTRYFNYTFTNTLNYRQNIGKSGDIYANLKLGYESQLSKGYFNNLQGAGFPLTLALQQAASTATPRTASATISNYSFLSQFSLLDFNYKDRYILSASFRRDGSSRFGSNNKYGNFWSVGASWNVDKEKFMASSDFISQLKLRASYGRTGNAGIGNYDYFPGYGFGANYNSTPGSFPNNVGNLDLTWEINQPFDLGIDIGILKNRVNFTADYYVRKSKDLLLDVPLSPTSGFLTVRKNVGSLENKGVEFTLDLIPVKTKNLTWEVNFNYARNTNKVTKLPDGKDILNGLFIYREGYDVQSYFLRKYAGVDQANGDPLWYTDSTLKNKQNVYSTAQRLISNSASPKYFGALTNTITFKGFTLEAQIYYSGGNYSFDAFNSFYLGAGANPTFNKASRILNRWQKPGDVTDIPRYVYGGNKSFQSSSTFYLNDATYARLRNLQLGYNLPQTILSKLKLNSVFFYIRGTNLVTWVKDKNQPFDPEQGASARSNLNEFIPKTVSAGLNLGF